VKAKIKLQLVSIQGDGYHLFFNVKVNGIEARFLIDTGASKTVLDKAFVNTLQSVTINSSERLTAGLGTSTLESEFAEIASLKMGKLEVNNINVAVIDLSHVNQTYSSIGLPQLNGVLGGDLLSEYKATINYNEQKLVLKKSKKAKNKERITREDDSNSVSVQ
jgi:predicted aspartyl protease